MGELIDWIWGIVLAKGERTDGFFFAMTRGVVGLRFAAGGALERPTETDRRRSCFNTGRRDSDTGDVDLAGEGRPGVTAFFVGDVGGVLIIDSAT